jgi:DNA repair protein RadC
MKYVRQVSVRYGKKHKSAVDIRGPEAIAKFARKIIKENGKEHLIMFCLDGNHSVVAYNVVAVGTATSAPVHPREVFQPAIMAGAVSIVLCHNHPSGNVEPSREDLSVTKTLLEASKYLGIKLLDHVIVGQDAYHSMHEHGQLNTQGRSLIG